jgi:uncharacterized protein involved in exopolysaccharide biosynthesis
MLEKALAILKVHQKLAFGVFLSSLLLLLAMAFLTPKIYETRSAIYIQKKIANSVGATSDPGLSAIQEVDLTDHTKIIKSNVVLEYVATSLREKFPKHTPLSRKKLATRLRVVSAKNTKVIELSIQDNDPLYAVTALSYFLEGYEKALKQIAKDTKSKSLDFLRERLIETQKKRHEAELQLEQLQLASGTIDIDNKNTELLSTSSSYSQALAELDAKIASSQQEITHLQEILDLSPNEIKVLSRIKEDPGIQALQQQLGREQSALADLSSSYTDKYGAVIDKKRSIQQIEKTIEQRITSIYSGPLKKSNLFYSEMDKSLGQKFLEENINYLGLLGQKRHYEKLITSLNPEFGKLATNKREVLSLQFTLDSLKEEERKLTAILQDGSIEQDIFDKLGSFTVITPPTTPKKGDYVFPLQPKEALMGGLFVSVLLSVFSVGMLEHMNPRIINLSNFPVIAEIGGGEGRGLSEWEVRNTYQSLALLLSKFKYKTITLLHLCGTSDMELNNHLNGDNDRAFHLPILKCPYSPGMFARQLAVMFSERGVKTLLLDYSQAYCDEDDSRSRECITQLREHTLYQYAGTENLHILRPTQDVLSIFDAFVLKQLPDYESYELVLINTALSENRLMINMVCEISEATVFCISQSRTSAAVLNQFQHTAQNQETVILGSLLFP